MDFVFILCYNLLMQNNIDINNDYISKEYEILNPYQFTLCIDDAKFTCITDNTFDKAHITPPMKQLEHLHFHSFYELFFVKEGSLLIRMENEEITLHKNDLFIISPNTMHRSFIVGTDSLRYNVNFYIEKAPIQSDVSLFSLFEKTFSSPYLVYRNNASMQSIFQKLGECLKSGDKLNFSLCFHDIINKIVSPTFTPTAPNHLFKDTNESRFYKIHHVVNLHYMDGITAKDIAKMLFLSTRQVSRVIRKYHNCSFNELITEMRLNAAVNFLTTTDMKILDIATTVGYNSLSCFYDAFTRKYGCLPLAYRKNHQNK